MSRLPIPGQDDDVWGDILNDFLGIAHNADGTLQPAALTKAGGITSINGATPVNGIVTLRASDLGVVPASADLSMIASTNRTAGNVSMNSNRIINLGNGSAPSDAATVGQIPTSLPPLGLATGDLTGNYPNPTVTSTHLSAALPIAQGGTGSTTQNFIAIPPAIQSLGTAPLFVAPAPTGVTALDSANLTSFLASLTVGCIALFPKGGYSVTGGLTVTAAGVTLQGPGRGQHSNAAALFNLASSASPSTSDVLHIAATGVMLKDISIYGNSTNQSATIHGISLDTTIPCNYFNFENVWISNCSGHGFLLQGGNGGTLSGILHACEGRLCTNGINIVSTDVQITDCYFDQNTDAGAYVNTGDISFTNCHIWGNGTVSGMPHNAGIYLDSSAGDCRFSSCYFDSNNAHAGIGLYVHGGGTIAAGHSDGHIITGCYFYNNGHQGIYAYGITHMTITGSYFYENNFSSSTDITGAGIELDTCTACVVTGCVMADNKGTKKQTYGYAENGDTCNGCSFIGNICRAVDHATGSILIGAGNPLPTTVVNTTMNGTQFGTANNQALGFFGATPVQQPVGNVLAALSNLGLVVSPTLNATDITGLPTSLPPSGSAGGDLAGAYPNPTVAKVNGISLPVSAPTGSGQVLISTGTGATAWQTPASGAVASVFGRAGVVTAQSGDYTAAQVGALPSTDDLSAIATTNATAGNVSLNSHKITNLANGTLASDAAAFGQVPTATSATPLVSSATAPTAGTGTTWARSDHAHPRYDFQPADHGLISWSGDPTMINSTVTLATAAGAAGTVFVVRLHCPVAQNVTNVLIALTSGGSGLLSSQCLAGLYQSGTLLGTTADQSGNWTSSGLKTMALSGGPVAVSAGDLYVAFFYNGTNSPTLLRGSAQNTTITNAGLSAAVSRFATANTGQTTSLPASLGALTANLSSVWAAIS